MISDWEFFKAEEIKALLTGPCTPRSAAAQKILSQIEADVLAVYFQRLKHAESVKLLWETKGIGARDKGMMVRPYSTVRFRQIYQRALRKIQRHLRHYDCIVAIDAYFAAGARGENPLRVHKEHIRFCPSCWEYYKEQEQKHARTIKRSEEE